MEILTQFTEEKDGAMRDELTVMTARHREANL